MDAFSRLAEPLQRSLWRMGWQSLRPLQQRAIEAVLTTDRDLVLAAPTASGKTEAAFLPILSAILSEPASSVRAVYVSPLKALINDQFRRLEDLCEYAEIPVHRWHGDIAATSKQKLIERPSGVLLITPESLESLFINRSSALPRLFRHLSFVVIDELHAMLGRERGTHLRSLLHRLEPHTTNGFRFAALSATLGDLNATARWLRPDAPERVTVLKDDAETKAIRYRVHAYWNKLKAATTSPHAAAGAGEAGESDTERPDDFFADVFRFHVCTKNLVFANAKSDVEEVADRMNELCRQDGRPEQFLVHHGSLTREIREHTEAVMQSDPPHTTVCSSTLELGIDIGNVTAVGQIEAPWSVCSLVQRLGRSGRHDDEPHQMRVFVTEDQPAPTDSLSKRLFPGLLRAIALTELMLKKWVEPISGEPWDFSTLIQQTLSILAETGGLEAVKLYERLVPRGAFRFLDAKMFASILREMARHELIEQLPNGPLIVGIVGEQIVRSRDFYSAFATPPEYRVVCDGRPLGLLPLMALPRVEDHLLLAGRRWRVTYLNHQSSEVGVQPAKGRKRPLFVSGGGEIHSRVAQEMRDVLFSETAFAYFNESAREMLAQARQTARDAGLDTSDLVATSDSSCLWFPWTGSSALTTLSLIAEHAGLATPEISDRLSMEFKAPAVDVIAALRRAVVSPPAPQQLAQRLLNKQRRKYDQFVDETLLDRSLAHDIIDIPEAVTCLQRLLATHVG